MKEYGIFYGSSSGNTESIAHLIWHRLGKEKADLHDIASASPLEMTTYDFLILGIPTWGIGELQDDWKIWYPSMANFDLSGKTVALFGLGDQESYSDTFADAMGILYRQLLKTSCNFKGSWPLSGYHFDSSLAQVNETFVGLVLDEDNQPELSQERINKWVDILLNI